MFIPLPVLFARRNDMTSRRGFLLLILDLLVVLFWNNHRVGRGGTGLPFGHRGGAGPNSGVEAPQAEKTHAPVELNNV